MPGLRAYAVGVIAILALAGCTSGTAAKASSMASTGAVSGSTTAPTTVPTRWWSNDAESAGSTIDPASPAAGAANLHPSLDEYCGMLKQTIEAGKSILPGVSATDPALLASTEAFITELQHVAPASVHAAWQTLGSAVITLVKSGGDASQLGSVDPKSVAAAATAVATDAKANCGLDVSAASPSPSPGK